MPRHSTDTPNRFVPSPAARRYIYRLALALAPALVAHGVLTGTELTLWLGVLEAALSLPVGLALANTPKGGPHA